jgi:hypothetical protein
MEDNRKKEEEYIPEWEWFTSDYDGCYNDWLRQKKIEKLLRKAKNSSQYNIY